MYKKFKEHKAKDKIGKDDMVLMSHAEFIKMGKDLKGVPVCITPDGKEPVEVKEELDYTPSVSTRTIPTLEQMKEAEKNGCDIFIEEIQPSQRR